MIFYKIILKGDELIEDDTKKRWNFLSNIITEKQLRSKNVRMY